MKKFTFLIPIFFLFFSCDEGTTTENVIDPTLLQKVIFNPGTSYETHWNFTNGILENIVKADGTFIEQFIYNPNNQLIQNIKYNNVGEVDQNYIITYNSDGIITQVNGTMYQYNLSENKYFYNNQATYECHLNTDGLITSSNYLYIDGEDYYGEDYYCNFDSNSNLTSLSAFGFSFTKFTVNFNYNTTINPLKNATLSLSKAKSLYDVPFFTKGLVSNNNLAGDVYDKLAPESSTFSYTYNANNLPVTQTQNDYYFGQLEGSHVSAHYYYQGDVFP